MSELERILFWLLWVTALAIAGRRLLVYIRCIRKGKGCLSADQPLTRLKTVLTHVIGQWPNIKTASTKDLAGPGHLLIFWGAIILALYYSILFFIGEGLLLSDSIRSMPAAHLLLTLSDIFSPLLAIGMLAAALRRSILKPTRLGPQFDAKLFWILTSGVWLLIGCYFGFETLRIRLGLSHTGAFLTNAMAGCEAIVSMTNHRATVLYRSVFWIQYALILALMVYGMYSNHRHPLFSPFNIFFQSFSPLGHIPAIDFTEAQRFGASRPEELNRKELLDGFACTHCGRCQDSCPAYATEKPLSPKQLLLDINRRLLINDFGTPPPVQMDQPSGIEMETLLSCTTCGACIEACPVMNRPLDSIIALRRHLVYEGLFEPGHATTLKRISQDMNPWGMRWHRRAQHFELPVATPDEHYDGIYWLGCAAAFDDRARRIAEAMAVILKRAGIKVAILGTAEKCCGDAVRRIGDEGLFQQLAKDNINLLSEHDFDFILTHCPHCFNALSNDYQSLGASLNVIHHSTLLLDLIRSKRIEMHSARDHIMYHDPCYLGRYNNIYQAPREVLGAFCTRVSEFGRNQANSFCCGAGGGHMWKTMETGERISVNRVEQALQSKPDQITSACPYCLLMFEEAVQAVAPNRPVIVHDIAEVVQRYLK